MKKIKNNKGITGVDITASIIILIIAVGIISSMYSKYIYNSKQIKRNTVAINLATDFIGYIKKTDYDILDTIFDDNGVDTNEDEIADKFEVMAEAEDDIVDAFGIEIKEEVDEFPSGYKVLLTKVDEIDGVAMKINVDVIYNIGSKEEQISLSAIKNKLNSQANPPNMKAEEVKKIIKDENKRFILRYSNAKEGYIQTNISDDNWYSISGKRYPVVVYAKEKDFDVNGIIDLGKCEEIYVWVPRFGKLESGLYGFCYESTNNMIIFGDTEKDLTYDIIGYSVDTDELHELTKIPVAFKDETGKWVKVEWDNENSKIISTDEEYIDLTTKQFTWEKIKD